MYIFLDESGDLGFDWQQSKPSRFFVITLLVCEKLETKKKISIAVKRTLKHLNHRKKKSREIGELKSTKISLSIKQYFFRQVPTEGWVLYTVILDKKKLAEGQQGPIDKKRLYNRLARIIIDEIDFAAEETSVNLIVDRCKSSKEIKEFNQFIQDHLQGKLMLSTTLDITHEVSQDNQCIQAVDLFCGGVFWKYELEDTNWYNFFKHKVTLEMFYQE